MKTSHALLITAFIFIAPFVVAQINFPDGTSQITAGQAQLVSIVVVSPVGTPIANGTALKTAYEAVLGATVDTPILVKVEPGVYDLGTGRIDLLPYVNLEGSGTESTIIQSTQDDSLIGVLDFAGASGAIEICDLTVKHTGTNSGLGIYTDSTMNLKNVVVKFSGTFTSDVFGVYNEGGNLRMSDCKVATAGYAITDGFSGVVGVTNTNANTLEMFDSTVQIVGTGAVFSIAVYNISGSTKLRHCVATVSDVASGSAVGIWTLAGFMLAGLVRLMETLPIISPWMPVKSAWWVAGTGALSPSQIYRKNYFS